MSHGLIVTDNFTLKEIYNLNLYAFVDLQCTHVTSIDEAIKIITDGPQIDVILCNAHINNERIANGIYNYQAVIDNEIPLIILGEDPQLKGNANIHTIDQPFNIRNVIRQVASILKITAQDMIKKDVPDFFPIHFSNFDYINQTNSTIYYINRSNNNFICLLNEGDHIRPKIDPFIKEGHHFFYVKAHNRLTVTNHISAAITSKGFDGIAPDNADKRLSALRDGYEYVTQNIQEVENIEDLMIVSSKCVESITLVADESKILNKLLKRLMSQRSSYPFKKSQLSAFISSYIVLQYEWGSKEHVEKLSFIAFFHDILLTNKAMSKIQNTKELDDSALSDKEKELVTKHAYLTSELIQKMPRAPLGADTIIKQHHGMLSGHGFEEKKFSNNLSPLTIIFIIAEAISHEILASEEIIDGQSNFDNFNLAKSIELLLLRFPNSQYKKATNTLSSLKF